MISGAKFINKINDLVFEVDYFFDEQGNTYNAIPDNKKVMIRSKGGGGHQLGQVEFLNPKI